MNSHSEMVGQQAKVQDEDVMSHPLYERLAQEFDDAQEEIEKQKEVMHEQADRISTLEKDCQLHEQTSFTLEARIENLKRKREVSDSSSSEI